MTPLQTWRARQHENTTTTSDQQLAAFLRGVDPRAAQLDRAAHASPVELRMIGAAR